VIDEVEQSLVRPVQVLENKHERGRFRKCFEIPAPRRECFVALASCIALQREQRAQVRLDPPSVGAVPTTSRADCPSFAAAV
jgi:hypothetical protein